VNTSEIWCANVGDSRAVMSTVRGAGKLQTSHFDLSRDHKSGKGLLQDEKVRIVKTGFQIRDNKIFHYM
jgi:hypothetical protein